jgi:DNA-binding MarR family transcriptional regulator
MEDKDEQNPILRIGESLRELNRLFFHTARMDAEICGVTPIQFMALRMLHKYPMIGLQELSQLMHTGASTASGVVDRLEKAGLILRKRAESNRRAIVLQLSPAGETLLAKADERIMKRLSPLKQLSDEDVEQLLRIHSKMIDILQKVREEP